MRLSLDVLGSVFLCLVCLVVAQVRLCAGVSIRVSLRPSCHSCLECVMFVVFFLCRDMSLLCRISVQRHVYVLVLANGICVSKCLCV